MVVLYNSNGFRYAFLCSQGSYEKHGRVFLSAMMNLEIGHRNSAHWFCRVGWKLPCLIRCGRCYVLVIVSHTVAAVARELQVTKISSDALSQSSCASCLLESFMLHNGAGRN